MGGRCDAVDGVAFEDCLSTRIWAPEQRRAEVIAPAPVFAEIPHITRAAAVLQCFSGDLCASLRVRFGIRLPFSDSRPLLSKVGSL